MGLHSQMLKQFLLIQVLISATSRAAEAVPMAPPPPIQEAEPPVPMSLPGCQESCGNLTIPYPFGTTEGCYLDSRFLITCNATTNTPFLQNKNVEVLSISVPDGSVRVPSQVAYDCYNASGGNNNSQASGALGDYYLSYSNNTIVAVGCDTVALIQVSAEDYETGCLSMCGAANATVDGSCSGIGCSQTSIPKGVRDYNISIQSMFNHTFVLDFNPCGYGFVVEDGQYNFSTVDLANFTKTFPVVLDWAIGNISCGEAQQNRSNYACQGNATCQDYDGGHGYRCYCNDGYYGNPYLSPGCLDINECMDPGLNNCTSLKNCKNTEGSYDCLCPMGHHGDGRKGEGCTVDASLIAVRVSTGIIVPLVILALVYCIIQRRNTNKQKEKHFKENGGIMLQKLISRTARLEEEKARIFTEDELKKATNNFSKTEIIGRGGFGTVYKGIIDRKEVAIKKSKGLDPDQVEQFINEVTILSQIDHPNVVKLLGCCLETPVPLLVYEFITNKTLHYHLHGEGRKHSLSWETRLRIAEDSASALAHMHSDTPIQVIHRDVKSANILLDDNFTAKVSDFGVSRLVPVDQTHLSTIVQGTLGYIDPEYFHSGILNEKSDVYSFGIVILELLTSERVLSPTRGEKDKSLAMFFISAMKDDRLFEILDERVKGEGDPEQLKGVAELARSCLVLKVVKRPTMKEVKRILRELRIYKCYYGEAVSDSELTDALLGLPTNFDGGSSSTAPQSLNTQEFTGLTSGR